LDVQYSGWLLFGCPYFGIKFSGFEKVILRIDIGGLGSCFLCYDEDRFYDLGFGYYFCLWDFYSILVLVLDFGFQGF